MGRTILPDPTPAPVAPSAPVTTAATPEATAAPPAGADGAGTVAAGVEGATGAAPPEVAATPEAIAKGERGRIAAEAAMAAAKRHREGLARQAQQDQERETLRRENAALKAANGAWQEFQQLAQSDKIAAARRLGLTPQEITKAALAEGTPEHSAKTLREEIAAEFEKKYGTQLAEQKALIDGWTNQQRAAAQQSAEKAVTTAAADATKYPNLAEIHPTMVLELARSVIAGTAPEQRALITNDDLLRFLESQQAEHRKARSSSTSPGTPTVATPTAAAGSPQPRTQVNGAKGAVLPPTPEGWDTWSDGKQKRWMSEQLEKSNPPAARQVASK